MKMKKLNEAGFGLAQVLIIISMLSSIAAYLFKQSGIATKSVRASFYKQELYTYNERLKDYLTNIDVCTEAFNGFSIGNEYNELNSSKFGKIFKKDDLVGSNKAFKVNNIKITNENTGFIKLVYSLEIDEKFKNTVFLPGEIKNEIHLFANIIEGGIVKDCYYDPYDDDYYDNIPNGVISQSIRKLCTSGKLGKNQFGANLDLTTMDCHVVGIDPKREVKCPKGYAIIKFEQNTNSDGKIELVPVCGVNPNDITKQTCPGDQVVSGVGINPNGTLNCEPIKSGNVGAAVGASSKNPSEEGKEDCVIDFQTGKSGPTSGLKGCES